MATGQVTRAEVLALAESIARQVGKATGTAAAEHFGEAWLVCNAIADRFDGDDFARCVARNARRRVLDNWHRERGASRRRSQHREPPEQLGQREPHERARDTSASVASVLGIASETTAERVAMVVRTGGTAHAAASLGCTARQVVQAVQVLRVAWGRQGGARVRQE